MVRCGRRRGSRRRGWSCRSAASTRPSRRSRARRHRCSTIRSAATAAGPSSTRTARSVGRPAGRRARFRFVSFDRVALRRRARSVGRRSCRRVADRRRPIGHRPIDRLTPIDRSITDRPTDRSTNRSTDRSTDRPTERSIGSLPFYPSARRRLQRGALPRGFARAPAVASLASSCRLSLARRRRVTPFEPTPPPHPRSLRSSRPAVIRASRLAR